MWRVISNYLITRAIKTPYYHLKVSGVDYMERFWLVPYIRDGSETGIGCGRVSWFKRPLARLLQTFDVAVRVHHIMQSDNDRAYHDHPWTYLTIILRGGYHEHTPEFDASGLFIGDRITWRGPGSILWRPAKSWHRLTVLPGVDCWTLFCTGPKRQSWGFMPNPAVKIHYRKFLKLDE